MSYAFCYIISNAERLHGLFILRIVAGGVLNVRMDYNIGSYSLPVYANSVWRKVPLYRYFKPGAVVKAVKPLHYAFAVSLLPNYYSPAVVLDCSGKEFRGAGATAVYKNGKRQ